VGGSLYRAHLVREAVEGELELAVARRVLNEIKLRDELTMSISKYLHRRKTPSHPSLRRWEYKLGRPGVERVLCQLHRPKNGLSYESAVLHVYFFDKNARYAEAPDQESWDAELNEWLLLRGARSTSKDNEAERFGFVLSDRLGKAEARFDEGYFNAVLRVYLPRTELGGLPEVAEKLKCIRDNKPQMRADCMECQEMMDEAFGSVGGDLTERLHYKDDDATEILGGAVAYYLDERFNISNRAALFGWLK
jgi:hypothetical protein